MQATRAVFGARAHADSRLSHARPFPRQARSARYPVRPNEEELEPASLYGFTDADMDRKIFLDKVLGLEFASMREIVFDPAPHLYSQTLASVACTSPIRHRRPRSSRSASRAATRRSPSPAKASARSSTSWSDSEGFENFLIKFTGTKHFGLDGAQIFDPGARQDRRARRQSRREGNPAGHAASRPPQRAHAGDRQAARVLFHEFKGGSATQKTSKAPAT